MAKKKKKSKGSVVISVYSAKRTRSVQAVIELDEYDTLINQGAALAEMVQECRQVMEEGL
jgi:hypothetical protein